MMWTNVILGERCSKIGSGATPRGGESVYQDEGVALIRSQNVYNGLFTADGLAFIGDEHADELAGVTVEAGDVLLNITGDSVARCAQVPDSILPARVNQHVAIIRPKPADFDARFLLYFFISPQMQSYMLSLAGSGGTRNALTKEMIQRFEIPKPRLATQRRIAEVLTAYDELMENNRRRMALLEEGARQLYAEWFVRLRFPGNGKRMKDEGGRMKEDALPKGWTRRRIGDIADCVGGGTPSTSIPAYWDDGDITWVTPTDITRNKHFVLLDSEKKITEAGLKYSSAKLVPPHAVLMTSRASVGFFGITGREVCTNQGFISIVPHAAALTPFLLFHLSSRVEEIRAMGSGSTYPEVSRGKFREFPIVVPPREIVSAFADYTSQLINQIRTLKRQTQKLRAARDLLLPRLMSGEIAV